MVDAKLKAWGLALGALLLVAYPWAVQALGEPYLISLGIRVLIFALAAVSLDLILGYGGLVSFGHAAYFGLGGYVVGILSFHLAEGEALFGFIDGTNEALIAWPAAVAVSALLALIIGALSLRTAGVHFIMITLAFAQMLFYVFVSVKTYGGDDGLIIRRRNLTPWIDLRDDMSFYYVCLAALVGFLILCRRLIRSRFGIVLRGGKDNDKRMAALGFTLYRYRLVAFVLAGAGAGLAGALLANQARFVSPQMLHWTNSGELMVMVILGGIGTLFGPVLGAAALIGLETALAGWTEHWMVILGPILVAIVLFARRGLLGVLGDLAQRWGQRHGG